MSERRVILVHGFNVRDRGEKTTDRLKPFFKTAGFSVIEFDTGFRFLLQVRFFDRKFAKMLAAFIRPGDVLLGHSDGCNIIDMACKDKSGEFNKESVDCVYLNPALDSHTSLAPMVKRALVLHTKSDWVVWISSFLLFHRWGRMGKTGYKPKGGAKEDPRYENCTYESLGIKKAKHSGVFKTHNNLDRLTQKLEGFLNA